MSLVNPTVGDCDLTGKERRYNSLPVLASQHRSRHQKIATHVLAHPAQHFWAKVHLAPSGCWEWQGWINAGGYGQIRTCGKNWAVHRFVFTLLGFVIPSVLSIDHLCRNRRCVNPDPLVPVPIRTNVLRGIGPSAQNAKKERCKRGHALTDNNVYRYSDGRRSCRQCARMHYRNYRRRKRGAA